MHMHHYRISASAALLASLFLSTSARAAEQNATTPGELRQYATIYSIGVELDIDGDANHNAICSVHFRPGGESAWREAFGLMRVDSSTWFGKEKADRPYNMLAGSVMFLEPGTDYELRFTLNDPDGGSVEKVIRQATRPMPARPVNGRTLHVVPGSGGGSGSEVDPLRGIESAEAIAQPGDTFLLHKGKYGSARITRSGQRGRPIVFAAAGDGDATFAHLRLAGTSWLWLEGLTFKHDPDGSVIDDKSRGLLAEGVCEDVVVRYCDFSGFNYSITLSRGQSRGWYIADNAIVGDKPPGEPQPDGGEGIELNRSSDHTVCHNRISRIHDGISYPLRNCDIFGNDMHDIADDGVEMDFAYSNIRIWSNRILMTLNEGFSFQPQFSGPWYLIRNEVVSLKNVLKFRVVCRFVLLNNTFVTHSRFAQINADMLLKSYSRNNLWIQIPRPQPNKPAKAFTFWNAGAYGRSEDQPNIMAFQHQPDWRTDVDYDGLDWGEGTAPFTWTGCADPSSLEAFVRDIGIEKHGLRVHREKIFEDPDVLAYAADPFPSRRLTLRPGSNAIDAGQAVPNLTAPFTGSSPDLGAHEHGRPATHYGPRPR